MDMVGEKRLERKMRILYFLLINLLADIELIHRRIKHGFEIIAF